MKYTVTVKCVEFLELEVEADSFDKAYDIAENADGGEFAPDPCPDWDIYCISDEAGRRVEY